MGQLVVKFSVASPLYLLFSIRKSFAPAISHFPFAFLFPLPFISDSVALCLCFKILNVANVLQHFDGFTSCVLLVFHFFYIYRLYDCSSLAAFVALVVVVIWPTHAPNSTYTHTHAHRSWPHNAAAFGHFSHTFFKLEGFSRALRFSVFVWRRPFCFPQSMMCMCLCIVVKQQIVHRVKPGKAE